MNTFSVQYNRKLEQMNETNLTNLALKNMMMRQSSRHLVFHRYIPYESKQVIRQGILVQIRNAFTFCD